VGLLAAWLAEVILISYRTIKQPTTSSNLPLPLPLPSQFADTFIIFGALSFLPASSDPLGPLIGWGFVVATFLNLWTPAKANAAGNAAVTVAQPGTTNAAGNTVATSAAA